MDFGKNIENWTIRNLCKVKMSLNLITIILGHSLKIKNKDFYFYELYDYKSISY